MTTNDPTTTLDALRTAWENAKAAEAKADRRYRRMRSEGTVGQTIDARHALHAAAVEAENARRAYVAAEAVR